MSTAKWTRFHKLRSCAWQGKPPPHPWAFVPGEASNVTTSGQIWAVCRKFSFMRAFKMLLQNSLISTSYRVQRSHVVSNRECIEMPRARRNQWPKQTSVFNIRGHLHLCQLPSQCTLLNNRSSVHFHARYSSGARSTVQLATPTQNSFALRLASWSSWSVEISCATCAAQTL